MAYVLAASLRAARPTARLPGGRCFGTAVPAAAIVPLVHPAARRCAETQAQEFAQNQRDLQRKLWGEGISSFQSLSGAGSVGPRARTGLILGEAGEGQAQHFTQDQLKEVKEMMQEAASQQADLQTELFAQSQANMRHIEQLSKCLEVAVAERAQLREEIDKLYTDLHALTEEMLKGHLAVRERVQRDGVKGRGGQSRNAFRPSIEDAERQPTHVCEMSHESLAELAMIGNHSAHRERLVREIMAVDSVSWEDAHDVLAQLDEYNEKYYWVESFPYRIGVPFNILCVIAGTMLVFNRPLALWYAENIAGEELPEGVTDINEMTMNQVGAWTWSWMEPMLGVATFVLLCFQFSRAQVSKMNMKTYGEHILQWRASRLARGFPQYDSSMVKAWAKHMPRVNHFFPVYEKAFCSKGPCSGL